MKNFWLSLPKPFLVLAPMENVTDTVFRQIVLRCGKPDIFFTEFTNTDGICSKGYKAVTHRLQFTKDEHPIVAQIWGNNPDHYFQSAKILKDMGFDGIDINMGCPDRTIVRKGCCAGLIKNPSLVKEIFLATKEGTNDLPISIKTRIGYNAIQTEEWIGFLLELTPNALTIHARTVKELSKIPAHWEEIGKIVRMRNSIKSTTLIIGNGDVADYKDALEKYEQYGVDGIMIGRGIFNNLWAFERLTSNKQAKISNKEKLQLLIDHITLFKKTWGEKRNFEIMKKYYKIYVSDIPHAAQLRQQLMNLKTAEETIKLIESTL